jgi:AcrR family transcriptional regulator/predicted DNA-binding transcriptional regulator AlpA
LVSTGGVVNIGTDRPLRISDLEKISGVGRSTIHYYMREGLLSPPRKTGKTMAYYDAGHVRELEEIKRLQEEGYPISFIRDMVAGEREQAAKGGEETEAPRSERRQQIMDKAVEIFARKGYHQTNVTEIAKAVGVGHSTFYVYFPSKMALFMECVDDVFQAMFADVWEEIKGEKNPVARLNRRAEVVLRSHPQFIDMMNVLKSIEEDDPPLEKKKRELYSSIVEPCRRDLARAIEMGLIPEIDVEIAAFLVVGFLESAWLLIRMNEEYTVERVLDAINAITFSGLAPAPAKKAVKSTTPQRKR